MKPSACCDPSADRSPPDVEDGGVVQEAVEDGAGHRRIAAEYFGPLGEAFVVVTMVESRS